MSISRFSNLALTRSELKKVKGGIVGEICRVCSGGGPSEESGACGGYVLSTEQAYSIECEMRDMCDDYYYWVECL